VVPTEVRELPPGWPATQLQPLDRQGTARLTLRSASTSFWVLEQSGKPVGMIKRTGASAVIRTASEGWLVAVRRRGRLGWQLKFTRTREPEATLRYLPRILLPGGSVVLPGGSSFKVRCPVLRDDWRVIRGGGGEVARIGFRGGPAPAFKAHAPFRQSATEEPLLLVVLLASAVAIVIHDEQPKSSGSPAP
jgi:hypothetical protein